MKSARGTQFRIWTPQRAKNERHSGACGKISHEAAAKAELEFSKYRAIEDVKPGAVDKAFEAAVNKLKRLKSGKKKP